MFKSAGRLGVVVTGLLFTIALAPGGCANGSPEGSAAFVPQDGGEGLVDTGIVANEDGSTDDASGDSSSASDTGSDTGADGGNDASVPANPIGFPCTNNNACTSGLCKSVVAGSGSSVCVTACTAQTDCPDTYFCDPSVAGATTGFCVPRSPAHCMTCTTSASCGSLSEVCGVATGDTVKACHVDCSIAGNAACPADYACVSTMLDGTAAMVCRPNAGLSCLDSLGGFCDRVATPQQCTRTNVAGTCAGQRACLTASNRFGSCAAVAPVCKATCSSTDPAGCTTSYCSQATADAANCGACNNVCPGYLQANANVTCNQPTCSFSCQGESYDVNNSATNGCEVTDPTTGNHSTNTATSLGDIACYDGSSDPNITGRLPSDSSVHASPSVAGFVTATGSAPDYYNIHAVGQSSAFNPCVDNIDLTLKMSGTTHATCYHLHIDTDNNTYDCDTDSTGTCQINPGGSGNYNDDTTISVIVSKRNITGCSATARENPSYTVKGHL
jgi:hypothetical protein